ncbi:MAG TPA: hypothetical protein VKZ82_28455 [Nonomuraea sp.]|nr:hypothetical protein [Nonomuraea sp.]
MSLATVDDWPVYAGEPVPEDAAALLAASSESITDYCGWPIGLHAVEAEEYDGLGQRVLTLHTLALVEVDAVRVDGAEVTDFRVSRRYGQIERTSGVWPCGFGRIQVDYTAGFDPVPPHLVKLAVELAAKAASTPLDVASETMDRRTIRYREAAVIGGLDAAALERYRLGPRP